MEYKNIKNKVLNLNKIGKKEDVFTFMNAIICYLDNNQENILILPCELLNVRLKASFKYTLDSMGKLPEKNEAINL